MTTTTTARNLTAGTIVRTRGMDAWGLSLTPWRRVAEVRSAGFGDRLINFADGTRARVSGVREFQVSTSRTLPGPLDVVAGLVAAYAAA